MKNEIKAIYLEDGTLHVVTPNHDFSEQLHVCSDGSMRRAVFGDDDAADCLGFIDDEASNDFSDDETEAFASIMEKAWYYMDLMGRLDGDGCLPEKYNNDFPIYGRLDGVSDGDNDHTCFVNAIVNALDAASDIPYGSVTNGLVKMNGFTYLAADNTYYLCCGDPDSVDGIDDYDLTEVDELSNDEIYDLLLED